MLRAGKNSKKFHFIAIELWHATRIIDSDIYQVFNDSKVLYETIKIDN